MSHIATPNLAAYMILEKDGKYAFLLRSNTDWMNGNYCLPSGKVEPKEPATQTVVRELKEELDITVQPTDIKHVFTMNRMSRDDEKQHWVDFYFVVQTWEGEPKNAEPHKHGELKWMDPKDLPENIVYNNVLGLEQITQGTVYYEHGF